MGITVLLHGDQEGSADMWPGGTEKVVASGNGVVDARELAQRHHATRRRIDADDGGKLRDPLLPAGASATLKQLRRRVAGQHRS
jgi:hypothetical protein